jgi:ABC-type antimicrobial peptide transport system permease subunit
MNIIVRTAGEPMDAVAALRRTILAIDPNLPITQVRTLADVLASGIAGPRLSATLLGVLSMVALFLAAVGLYGVVSFSVLQRTREIGIRAALGAQRDDILRLVLGQGLVLVTIGLGVGLLLAVASQRIVASQLFGIGPHDPMTFGAVGLTLAVVALSAAVLPALRATRIDPLVALREE